MELAALKPLYSNILQQGIGRAKFSVQINKVVFDAIYFIDSFPNSIAIGVKNENFYFEVNVQKNFRVSAYLGEHYGKICSILGLTPDKNNPYSPTKFFTELNDGIPSTVTKNNVPLPEEIAPYRSDVKEADRIYFSEWRLHNSRNVTDKNLKKTRLWLGEEAFQMCKKKNVSSCWTDKVSEKKSHHIFP